jgi:hypothetical protein
MIAVGSLDKHCIGIDHFDIDEHRREELVTLSLCGGSHFNVVNCSTTGCTENSLSSV